MPELPRHRRDRFVQKLELPLYDADLLTANRATADYFEEALNAGPIPATAPFAKAVSNWMLGEMSRLINQNGDHISEVAIKPSQLADLQGMIDDGTLSSTMAKTVFEKMYQTGDDPKNIAQAEGLSQISDTDAVLAAVQQAIEENPGPVQEYLGGKRQVMGFIIGQVMKATRGKANPRVASQLVRERLEAMRE